MTPSLISAPSGEAPPGARARTTPATLSVVVPVSERPEPLAELYAEYAAALRDLGYPFEFVFAVEPYHRRLATPLTELAARGEPVRVVVAGQAAGETALLSLALAHAAGSLILVLPAYRRVEAAALPALLARAEQGADLVAARRWPRKDSWINRAQNRAFHALLARTTGSRFHDTACGVYVVRREVLQEVPLYGDFLRFLPLLAAREGYTVLEEAAPQHPGDHPRRVYSPGVYLRRLVDVLGLYVLLRFTEKPLRFFGLIGSGLSLAGALVLAILAVQRLQGQGIADRPLLLLGVLLVVMGIQAIALGLIGEIVVHLNAPRRRPYRLAGRPAPPAGPS